MQPRFTARKRTRHATITVLIPHTSAESYNAELLRPKKGPQWSTRMVPMVVPAVMPAA